MYPQSGSRRHASTASRVRTSGVVWRGKMKKRGGCGEGAGERCALGFAAAAAAGCCGDRSQGNSFEVRALDRSAKKVTGGAAHEISVYTSLIACMHVETRHCDLRRLWTLAIADNLPRRWTLASPE